MRISANNERARIVEELQETTLEILSRPQVEEGLNAEGFDVDGLTAGIKDMFSVPRDGSKLLLPKDQADTNAVGIHPTLPRERYRLAAVQPVGAYLRPVDKTRINDSMPIMFGLLDDSQVFPPTRVNNPALNNSRQPFLQYHRHGYTANGTEHVVVERPIVVVPALAFKGVEKALKAGVVASLVDMAARITQAEENPELVQTATDIAPQTRKSSRENLRVQLGTTSLAVVRTSSLNYIGAS